MKIMITGVAGFIGSHLLSHCLGAGHQVIGIDNFLTGRMSNIEDVLAENAGYARQFELLREDIRHPDVMIRAAEGVDLIFHEAAIGSVPWSIREPLLAHETNLTGFLNILEAAKANHIKRVIYASSSAVFGDSDCIPAKEGAEGSCLSVYASSKRSQEIYAEAYARCYGLEIIGLRYFNVFGRRQDPNGAYAAVIPRWAKSMASGVPCTIFGDGHATRDYCHVSNIVRANMLAASVGLSGSGDALAMNIGCGTETSLLELHAMMAEKFEEKYKIEVQPAHHEAARLGDIERSVADISLAGKILGFSPEMSVREGVHELIETEQFDIIRA